MENINAKLYGFDIEVKEVFTNKKNSFTKFTCDITEGNERVFKVKGTIAMFNQSDIFHAIEIKKANSQIVVFTFACTENKELSLGELIKKTIYKGVYENHSTIEKFRIFSHGEISEREASVIDNLYIYLARGF